MRASLEASSKSQSKLLTMTETMEEVRRLLKASVPPLGGAQFLAWAEKDLNTPAVLKKLPNTKSALSSYVSRYRTQRTSSPTCSGMSKASPTSTSPGCDAPPCKKQVKAQDSEMNTGQQEGTPLLSPPPAANGACKSLPAPSQRKDSGEKEVGKPTGEVAKEKEETKLSSTEQPLACKHKAAQQRPEEQAAAEVHSPPEQEIIAGAWTPSDDWRNFASRRFQGAKLSLDKLAELKNIVMENNKEQLGKSYERGGVEHWFYHHYTQQDEYAEDKKVITHPKHTCMIHVYQISTYVLVHVYQILIKYCLHRVGVHRHMKRRDP